MAAVDVGDTSHVGRNVTRFILDLATSLGQQDDSDVHLVHAWSSVGERMATAARRGLLPAAEIEREVQAEEARRQALFQEAVAPYLQLPVRLHLHLIHGDARAVLPVFARDRQMDLLVMGTLARTGIPGFFMGNTAEDVLRQVDASVLTLKPEGFLSPVQ
jgi:nucleotide-binding universal stress UspA family protein